MRNYRLRRLKHFFSTKKRYELIPEYIHQYLSNMSKSVISNISCSYGSITGNVSSISTDTTTVLDQSDLDSLERRINSKINSLESQVKELKSKNDILSNAIKTILSEYKSLSSNLVSDIKRAIAEGNDELWDILNKEME